MPLLRLRPKGPFRLDYTALALMRRPINALDRLEEGAYRRRLWLGERCLEIRAWTKGEEIWAEAWEAGGERPALLSGEEEKALVQALDRLLGLSLDLTPFYAWARDLPRLAPLVRRFLGLKPPRFPTRFEALANAVACQQVSLELGLHLLNRLLPLGQGAFPRPQDLLRGSGEGPEGLRALGFSRAKAETLLRVARLPGLETLPEEALLATLAGVKGLGPWSLDYLRLRGLGHLQVFPRKDRGAYRGLARFLGRSSPPSPEEAQSLLAPYAPFAGLLYLHLLLDDLEARGLA